MFKTLSVVMILALLAGVLAACTPAATPAPAAGGKIKGGPLEIGVLWEEGSPSYDIMKKIGDSMEKDYPGTKVTYTFNNTAARPAIEQRMQAGNPLDIDFIFEGMDPNSYSWVDGGYIMDITSAMNEKRADGTTWKDDFNPLFLPSMVYKDKYYGAGEQVFVWLLHYNKKMFDEWKLTPPKTWDEFLTLCETIKGKGVAPVAVTGQVHYYVGMWTDSLLQRYAGTEKVMEYLYGTKGTKAAGDADFLKAMQESKKLVDKGYLIDGWQGTDFTTNQVYFFQGKAAMILMGSWLMSEMKASIPAGYQLAVAPFPSVSGGKGKQDAVFGRVLSWNVPAKSKSPELAVEFLRRMTSVEYGTLRSKELGAVSPLRNVPPPAGITDIDKTLKDAEKAEFILYNYGAGSAQFGLADAWYNPVVEMWLGKLTPEQTLAKIDTNIEAVRAQRAAAKK
jgi:raffinose/stachyose/melibiose transport system substrate-binding protein